MGSKRIRINGKYEHYTYKDEFIVFANGTEKPIKYCFKDKEFSIIESMPKPGVISFYKQRIVNVYL